MKSFCVIFTSQVLIKGVFERGTTTRTHNYGGRGSRLAVHESRFSAVWTASPLGCGPPPVFGELAPSRRPLREMPRGLRGGRSLSRTAVASITRLPSSIGDPLNSGTSLIGHVRTQRPTVGRARGKSVLSVFKLTEAEKDNEEEELMTFLGFAGPGPAPVPDEMFVMPRGNGAYAQFLASKTESSSNKNVADKV